MSDRVEEVLPPRPQTLEAAWAETDALRTQNAEMRAQVEQLAIALASKTLLLAEARQYGQRQREGFEQMDLDERKARADADTLRTTLSRVSALADELEREAPRRPTKTDPYFEGQADALVEAASRIREALKTDETKEEG